MALARPNWPFLKAVLNRSWVIVRVEFWDHRSR